MEKFGFFNSINNDRTYDSADFALFLSKYFTNGVFNDGLSVIADDGMTIKIKNGDANINGYRYTNDDVLSLNLNVGDTNNTRVDNIVIRFNLNDRKISAMVVEGVASSSPVAPDVQRNSIMYDLVLAQITIPAGTTQLKSSMIKDTRYDENICGIVAGAVKQIGTTDLFNQFEAYFNEWFENVKDQLSTDAAGNLQNQIDILNTNTILVSETEQWGE